MAYSTSSTTAINGSADEFAASPTLLPPRTPTQVAADVALSSQRVAEFVADPSLPVTTPRTFNVIIANTAQSDPTVARTQAAYTHIANFDAAFNDGNNDNSDSNVKN